MTDYFDNEWGQTNCSTTGHPATHTSNPGWAGVDLPTDDLPVSHTLSEEVAPVTELTFADYQSTAPADAPHMWSSYRYAHSFEANH